MSRDQCKNAIFYDKRQPQRDRFQSVGGAFNLNNYNNEERIIEPIQNQFNNNEILNT